MARGLIYELMHRWMEAIADYSEAIRLDPGRSEAYLWRGYAHYKLEERAQAIADYSQALRLDPGDESAFFYRAQAYRDEQRWDLSLVDFYAAAQLKPDDVRVMNGRGILYREAGSLRARRVRNSPSPSPFGRPNSQPSSAARCRDSPRAAIPPQLRISLAHKRSAMLTTRPICRSGSISPMPGADGSTSPFWVAPVRSRTRAHGPAPSLPSIAASSPKRR